MRLAILLSLLTFISACSSVPTKFPEEQGVTCYQTEDQEKAGRSTCLRINSFSDPVKWHRVRTWQTLPDIPDLP